MPPKPRRFDPATVRGALSAQWGALVGYTAELPPQRLAAPSRLPAWTVRQLVAHIALGVGAVRRGLAQPGPERPDLSLASWARGTASAAAAIDTDTREVAQGGIVLAAEVAAAERALSAAADGQIVVMRLGAMRLGDLLVTRLVEAVVHADDLDPEFAHDRAALALVTKALADVFAAKAPGRAVELRVPPFAAVQCVEGPRHTRGTPRSAVETDPLTWVRLA
ncbi:MAG: sterol carrier family protein, partial [Streptomycetales bacterium]